MLVLLSANVSLSKGHVNGSLGRIVGFVSMEDDNMPRASTGKPKKDQAKFQGQLIYGDHSRFKQAQIRRFRDALPEASRKWPVVQFKV